MFVKTVPMKKLVFNLKVKLDVSEGTYLEGTTLLNKLFYFLKFTVKIMYFFITKVLIISFINFEICG